MSSFAIKILNFKLLNMSRLRHIKYVFMSFVFLYIASFELHICSHKIFSLIFFQTLSHNITHTSWWALIIMLVRFWERWITFQIKLSGKFLECTYYMFSIFKKGQLNIWLRWTFVMKLNKHIPYQYRGHPTSKRMSICFRLDRVNFLCVWR